MPLHNSLFTVSVFAVIALRLMHSACSFSKVYFDHADAEGTEDAATNDENDEQLEPAPRPRRRRRV